MERDLLLSQSSDSGQLLWVIASVTNWLQAGAVGKWRLVTWSQGGRGRAHGGGNTMAWQSRDWKEK
jgi:hypothetical protein